MMPFIVRVLKRLSILLVGVLVIYVAVDKVFPFFDNRTPISVALFATYVAMAYFIIPAITRVVRLFIRPSHFPLYCVTPDGFASDPLNIGLLGSRPEVILAMEAAGWHVADPKTPHNSLRLVLSYLLERPYPTAPMSKLYLFGRGQDLAFEKPIDAAGGHRHHVRFWGSDVKAPQEFEQHAKFWQRVHRPKYHKAGRQLWIGAASKDVGLAPIRHNAQLTHMIDPDTNAERQLIVHDLRKANKLSSTKQVTVNKPYSLSNRAWRGFLHSDGIMTICTLKR